MSLNPPLRDWRGRHVWVLGASTGIGRAVAEALLARGAHVRASARNARALEEWHRQRADARPGMGRLTVLPLDVGDAAAVQAAARSVIQEPLDLLLYCAGHYRALRATAFDLPEMLRHQQTNYVGALHALDAVLPAMLARGRGHVSLVSSVAGFRGLPRGLAYGPTKAALTHLAETLYLDLRPRGLGVSVVHPGFVETPLTARNEFPMPALISAQQAAQAMLDGWAAGAFELHFPRRFTLAMKLLRLLPYRLYFPLVRKVTGL